MSALEKQKSANSNREANSHLQVVRDLQTTTNPSSKSIFKKVFRGLRGRMLLMGLAPVFMMIAVSFFVDFNIRRISNRLNSVVGQFVPALIAGKELVAEVGTIRKELWRAIGNEQDPNLSMEFAQNAEEAMDRFEKSLEKFNNLPLPEKAIVIREEALTGWVTSRPKIAKSIELLRAQNADYRKFIFEQLKPTLESFEAALANLEKYNVEVMESEKEQANVLALTTRISSGTSALAVLVLSLILSLYITSNTVRKIASVSRTLNREAKASSDASTEMAQVISMLSDASTSTASSIEEITASMEEMNSMVKSTSTNAIDASKFSEVAVGEAQKGEREMETLVRSIQEMAKNSKKVEDIVEVIDDISFQTNLLALNAAVEAARAGEHGKGFAVVADAVRSLAQKSAQSAKEITNVIRENSERINQSTTQADRSVDFFKRIVQSIEKVSEINNEISAATENQSQGISGVNGAMNNLNNDSNKNVRATEQMSATFSQITHQTEILEEAIKELNTVVGG